MGHLRPLHSAHSLAQARIRLLDPEPQLANQRGRTSDPNQPKQNPTAEATRNPVPYTTYLDVTLTRTSRPGSDDPHLWGTALFGVVNALGYGQSYVTFVRKVRERDLRPSCGACGRTRGRPVAIIDHPDPKRFQPRPYLVATKMTPDAVASHRSAMAFHGCATRFGEYRAAGYDGVPFPAASARGDILTCAGPFPQLSGSEWTSRTVEAAPGVSQKFGTRYQDNYNDSAYR